MAAISPKELMRRMAMEPGPVVLDLREHELFASAAIMGARHIAYDGIAARLARAGVDRRSSIVLVCSWGHRSAIASIALKREGFRDVSFVEGGMEAWGLAGGATRPGVDDLRLSPPEPEGRSAAAGA